MGFTGMAMFMDHLSAMFVAILVPSPLIRSTKLPVWRSDSSTSSGIVFAFPTIVTRLARAASVRENPTVGRYFLM
jgi:hypothetical protein